MSDGDHLWTAGRVRRRLQTLGMEPEICFERAGGISKEGLKPAGVLIPLTEIEGQMTAVFTKRPDTMAEHSGEVSFPGGGAEAGDRDLRDTALREAHEEIALQPRDIRLYGSLVRMPTISSYDITSFVGEFEQPYELDPNPREIETIFSVPLVELADPDRHRLEERTWEGQTFELHFYDCGGQVIWGVTGYMVSVLLDFLRKEA